MRRISRETGLTAPKIYRTFGSLESLIERAGLKVDKETLKRIKSTRKATRRRVKKTLQKAVPKFKNICSQPSGNIKQSAAPTFEKIQEDLETEQEAHKSRLEKVQKFAEEVEALALDGAPEVSGPVLDALCNILPTILQKKYGVPFSLKDLLEADHTLHQVEKERKELRAEQLQLDGMRRKNEAERLEIRCEWEKLKANPEKTALKQRVERLQGEKRALTSKLGEAFDYKRKAIFVFNALLETITPCNSCVVRFSQLMNPYPDEWKWFKDGEWSRL